MATKNAEVIANEKIEEISNGAMTKAGRLAMELANEKKRLIKNLKSFKQNMMKLNQQLQQELEIGMLNGYQ